MKFEPLLMPILISLTFIAIDLNAWIAFSAKLQYMVVIVTAMYVLTRKKEDYCRKYQFIGGQVIMISLFIWGFVGIYYGKIILYLTNGPLPLIFPLVIACLPSLKTQSGNSYKKESRLIAILCILINWEVVLAQTLILGSESRFIFSHEKAFLQVLGFAAAVYSGSKRILFIQCLSSVLAMITYPAGTYVLAFLVGLLTFVISKSRSLRTMRLLMLPPVIWFFSFVSFNLTGVSVLANGFYNSVGRTNNVAYREYLIEQFKLLLDKSPWTGTGFTGSVLVQTQSSFLPLHNDFFTIAIAGGYLAVAMYLSTIFLANGMILRTINLESVPPPQHKLLVMLLCSLNSYVVVSLVNPISMKAHNTVIFASLLYAIYSIKKSISVQ